MSATVDQVLFGAYLALDLYKLTRDEKWTQKKVAELCQTAKTPKERLAGARELRREAAAKAKADIAKMVE